MTNEQLNTLYAIDDMIQAAIRAEESLRELRAEHAKLQEKYNGLLDSSLRSSERTVAGFMSLLIHDPGIISKGDTSAT